MNTEEALNIVNECMAQNKVVPEAKDIEFFEVVKYALNKRVAKKPHLIVAFNQKLFTKCPQCGADFEKEQPKFCGKCGQRVAWED